MESIHLPIAEYRFNFTATTDIQLPVYSGSAWRGLFGISLKHTVCVTGEKECKNCLLWRNCVYSYIFETPPPKPSEIQKNYQAAPHPFVISPRPGQPEQLAPGDSLSVDMLLIGKANQHLPYIIHAFQQAGKKGIGQKRGRFELQNVDQNHNRNWLTIYQPGGKLEAIPPETPRIPESEGGIIEFHLLTPFRSVQRNKRITPQNFEFQHFISPLIRRLSLLSTYHTDQAMQCDFKSLAEAAKNIRLQQQRLEWFDWQRYSSRQQNRVPMGGIVGNFQITSRDLARFWNMLVIGQKIHVGKGTVMGLGKYHMKQINKIREGAANPAIPG